MISAIPFSCTKNEVIENPKPDPSLQGVDLSPIMIVNVNDEEYTITDFENTLLTSSTDPDNWHRLDLRCSIDSNLFFLTIGNYAFQNPPEKGIIEKTYHANPNNYSGEYTACDNDVDYCDGANASFYIVPHLYTTVNSDGNDYGWVNISNCDTINKTVSGSFDCKVKHILTSDSVHLSGTFSNLDYFMVY